MGNKRYRIEPTGAVLPAAPPKRGPRALLPTMQINSDIRISPPLYLILHQKSSHGWAVKLEFAKQRPPPIIKTAAC